MKRALFLDGDGVINIDKKYTHRIEDFEFCDGIFKFCRIFTQKNYLIFVITNQSGIARGYYDEKDFATLSAFMCEEFAKEGILIDKIYHRPHLEGCGYRKPKPGMFLKAYEEFDIDRENSFFIGDNLTDMQAGLKAGFKKLHLINSTQKDDLYQNYINLNALLKDIEKGEICI